MLTGVRRTGKTASRFLRIYAPLFIAILSLGLAGCAGVVTAGGGGTQITLTISGLQASAATSSSFQVSWTTNIAASSAVDYGISSSYGSSTPVNAAMVTSHQLALSNLTAGTLYHFSVRSTDGSNNTATSGDMTFATTTTAPVPSIASLNPTSGAVGTPVTISGANFGSTQGTSTVKFNGTAATATSWSAASIVAPVPAGATTGNVVVSVGGVASNGVSFTVQGDTTPPSVPMGLTASAISSSQISLSWTASTDNVGVTGYNIYRGGSKIGTTVGITYLDSGLTASTSYTYNVSAFDAAGNTSAQSAGASATTQGTSGGGGIPSALGWYQIPNTKLSSVCPSGAGTACANVIAAWSGGIADTSRNRLIMWGGGHTDYSGNELYALDLNSLTMMRITNPSSPVASSCVAADPDGNPNSRHTYAGMAYIANQDRLYEFAGSLFCASGASGIDTWTFGFGNNSWQRMDPTTGAPPGQVANYQGFGDAADYDPNTGLVFVTDNYNLFSYSYGTNTYTQVHSFAVGDYHRTGVIDPGRKFFFAIGNGGGLKINIAAGGNYAVSTLNMTNCGPMLSSAYPGLAYDPVQKLIVGWAGGDTSYLYNPDTDSCTSVTYPNGPGAQQTNGTFGRFRYFPSLGVFAVVNDWQENAYSLRLTASSGGSGGPAITQITVTGITTTGATVSWTTDVPATTQVEYGTTTGYGTLTTLNSTLTTSHSQALTGLTLGTAYHYRVHSKNSGGTESISGDAVFSTNSTTDTTPPTVSMTAPASGASVSGSVTVSANASDNVGVASVQFMLDGGNLGSALTASPYQMSWDTTTTSNGSHALTAVAKDAAGNTATANPVSVTASNTISTALQDFQTRCAKAGVILCQGFDDPAVFAPATWPASGLYAAGDGSFGGTIDSTVTASGGGSLKFTIPSKGPANSAGYWRQLFTSTQSAGPPGAQMFSQNSTFYIQYRQRFSPEYLSNQWPASGGGTTYWKQQIISNDNSTCGNVELSTVNDNNYGYPMMYSQCGADVFQVSIANSDFLNEQGDTSTTGYNCHYQKANNTSTSCFLYPSNTWVTFYYKVSIGTWGQPNSMIQAWVSVGGGPYKEWINITNHTLLEDTAGADYDMVTLLPYMTGRDASVSAGPTAYTWYDELIVSSQPIAAPNN